MADNYDFIPAAASTGDTATDYNFVPVHEFDYSPIQASTKDRDELANMWMAKSDFLGGHGPQTLEELNAIKTKASAVGLSLDDVMAAAQEKMTPSERASVQRFRYAGPVGRGIVQSENSTMVALTNATYRGLSFIPGYEHFSTKADENNRSLDTAGAVIDQLNREGSMADIIGPTGASLMGNVSQGLMDVATVAAVPGGAAGATEGMTAEAPAATANKAAALAASKKAAIFFGLKQGEHQLTVGTDAGLSPNMRIANAAVQGSITGAFTYGFGQWAQQLGLSTTEQAAIGGSDAVGRLMTRTGLTQAANSVVLSGGEQSAMSLAEQGWGSLVGTDTMDDWGSRTAKGAATGALMRSSEYVLPAVRDFHDAYTKTQEALPETVKGTIAAQNVVFKGTPEKSIENESPAYKDAYNSEKEALEAQKAEAMKTLDAIAAGHETLKTRVEKFLAAKKESDVLNTEGGLSDEATAKLKALGFTDEQIAEAAIKEPKAGAQPIDAKTKKASDKANAELSAEQSAIKDARDQLAQHKKDVEFRLKEIEQSLGELSDADKKEIKSQVIDGLENKKTADSLDQGKVNLTRAENELNAKFRAQEGYEALEPAQRIEMETSLRNARAKGFVADADNIAKDIVSNKGTLTYDKQNGLLEARLHRGDTIQKAEAILADPKATEAAKRDATIERDNARKSEDIISRALGEGASDPARVLAARQHDSDNLKPNTVRETGRARKGSDLTQSEANDLTDGANKVVNLTRLAENARNEKPADKPLSREAFAFRETLRAEQFKGSALTPAEADSVAAHARALYDTTGDINALDAVRTKQNADDLFYEAHKARAALESKILSLEPKTFGGQIAKGLSFASGLLREWLTTGDLLPSLRQGILYPSTWPAAFKGFFQAIRSEKGEVLAARELSQRPLYKLSQEGETPIRIMKANDPYQFQEGGMANLVANKFPFLRRFAGAYRTGVNEIRLGAFESLVKSMGGASKWDSKSLDHVRGFVNCGTGYGTLGGFEQSAGALAHIMLAPRFFWSRLQYFTGWPLMKAAYAGDKAASQVMLKAYVKQVAGLAAMTAFAEVAGKAAFGDDAVEFHRNPTDFDFGRLRIGNTMIDITGGLAKPFRYATALAEPLVAATQDRPSLKRTGPTLLGIGRSSLAPVPSALISAGEVYAGGKDANGELQKYIFPWSWTDSVTAMMNEGLDKGSAITALNMFGAGSYTTERNK